MAAPVDSMPARADGAGDSGIEEAATSDAPFDSAGGDGGNADGPTSCVTQTITLATSATNPQCAFDFTLPPGYTLDQVNVVLTPGWGTVCFGYGCGAQGGWFWSGSQIALCDTTCSMYASQPAGTLTVQLGCPTSRCN